MHERECKGYISFNRGVNEFNRGVNELNRGVNDLNRGVNHSVARQGCNLLRAAMTSAVTSQGCCCGNLQIHPLDLGQCMFVCLFSCCVLFYLMLATFFLFLFQHFFHHHQHIPFSPSPSYSLAVLHLLPVIPTFQDINTK